MDSKRNTANCPQRSSSELHQCILNGPEVVKVYWGRSGTQLRKWRERHYPFNEPGNLFGMAAVLRNACKSTLWCFVLMQIKSFKIWPWPAGCSHNQPLTLYTTFYLSIKNKCFLWSMPLYREEALISTRVKILPGMYDLIALSAAGGHRFHLICTDF